MDDPDTTGAPAVDGERPEVAGDEFTDELSEEDSDEVPDGLITIRGALYGVGLLWLTAVATIGAIQAIAYGAMVAPIYLVVAVLAGAVAVVAAGWALQVFGYR